MQPLGNESSSSRALTPSNEAESCPNKASMGANELEPKFELKFELELELEERKREKEKAMERPSRQEARPNALAIGIKSSEAAFL